MQFQEIIFKSCPFIYHLLESDKLDAKYSPVLVCRYLSVSLPVLGVLRVTDGPLFCGGELQFRIHKYN